MKNKLTVSLPVVVLKCYVKSFLEENMLKTSDSSTTNSNAALKIGVGYNKSTYIIKFNL